MPKPRPETLTRDRTRKRFHAPRSTRSGWLLLLLVQSEELGHSSEVSDAKHLEVQELTFYLYFLLLDLPSLDLADTEDGGTNRLSAVCRKESPRRSSLPRNALAVKMNQEGGVRYHLRPPDRLPRSRSILSSLSRLAF